MTQRRDHGLREGQHGARTCRDGAGAQPHRQRRDADFAGEWQHGGGRRLVITPADQWCIGACHAGVGYWQRSGYRIHAEWLAQSLASTVTVGTAMRRWRQRLWRSATYRRHPHRRFPSGERARRGRQSCASASRHQPGTYSVSLRNGGQPTASMSPISPSPPDRPIRTPMQTFVIPGDTTGTWRTDTGSRDAPVDMLAAGATFAGVAAGRR